MAFRSISVNQASATDLDVTAPAGVVSGDVLVAYKFTDVVSGTFTWPSGFAEITGSPLHSSNDGMTCGVAIKIATGSEPGTYRITSAGGGAGGIGGVASFSGCGATQPQRTSVGSSNASNASAWSMTTASFSSTTATSCDLLFIASSDNTPGGDVVHSNPATYTIPTNGDITDSAFLNGYLAYKENVSAGETGALTGTGTLGGANSGWGAFAIALELTASGPGSGADSLAIPVSDLMQPIAVSLGIQESG